jgi:hypothetical protein
LKASRKDLNQVDDKSNPSGRRRRAARSTALDVEKHVPAGSSQSKKQTRQHGSVPPPSETLIAYLAELDLKVGELALALREIVMNEAPGATESIYRSYVVCTTYSLTGKYADVFCHIAVYPRHVNLGFNRGAELDDPEGLLIGTGKIIRHLKVAGPQDLGKHYLRRFIRAAIKHSKAHYTERAPGMRRPSATTGALKRRRSI